MEHRCIGVIGAGTMGRGVCQSLAETGHEVELVDERVEALEAARKAIRRGVRHVGLLRSDAGPVDADAVLARISTGTDLQALENVDFVIENVTENWDIKRKVYAQIDSICRPEVVFGVNTSAVSITRVGGVTCRPQRVVGMHFMNPVPLMPTVEVVRSLVTSDETLDEAKGLLAAMGMECIVVADSPGFVTNRVMMQMVNEAIFLLDEGVASIEAIDRLFKSCFGHKMGPLETADMIGLDTILYSIEMIQDGFADSKYRPCTRLKQMVDAGLLGVKSGRGFYTYAAGAHVSSLQA